MKQIKDCYNDFLEWISTNKVRLLITFIIAFIISIILPIWGYTTNDAKLSDCVAFALLFSSLLWFLFYNASKMQDDINDLFEGIFLAIGYLILFIVCIIIAIGGLYIAIKIIKFMWYC